MVKSFIKAYSSIKDITLEEMHTKYCIFSKREHSLVKKINPRIIRRKVFK